MDAPNKFEPENNKKCKVNPRENASFLSKIFFCWSLPIFYKGLKKTLSPEDLFGTLKVHESKTLGSQLELAWNRELAANKNPSLWRPLIKTFWKEVAAYGLLYLIMEIVVKMAQPLLLAGLMAYYEPKQTAISEKDAYYYAGGLILATFASAVLTHNYYLGLQTAGMKIRISCCGLVYRKALKISQSALAENTIGKMINIIANDVGRFDYTLIHLNNFWVAPIESAIVMYLLYTNLGPTALAGVAILLAFIPIQSFMGKMTSVYRMRTALKTDIRVRFMNEIISGIQVIKMYTWEKPFAKLVEAARKSEIHQIKGVSYLKAVNFSFVLFLNRAAIYLCVLTYVLTGHVLNAQYVYVAASFYGMIRNALTMSIPFGINNLAETNVSVNRIQKFLKADEISQPNQENIVKNEVGIKMRNASVKWSKSSEDFSLNDVNFEAAPRGLTAVIGTVGSGKSTLLQVILKELPVLRGTLYVGGRISYASQEPWIFAGSVRQNILFGAEYDRKRYRDVTSVCALERDFALFPHGDATIVGDRGVMLSGGQKARINLARAVYKEADVYLLDDPLSAVDAHVGKQLFDDCVSGYLADKCTILVTHQLQYLRNVERIYLVEGGRIGGVGTYAELHHERRDFLQRLLSEQPKDKEAEGEENEEGALKRAKSVEEKDKPVEVKEEQTQGSISKTVYLKYLKAAGGYGTAFAMLLVFVLAQTIGAFLDYFLTIWVNLEQDRAENNQTYSSNLENATDFNSTATSLNDTVQDLRWSFLTPYNCIYIHSTLLGLLIVLSLTRSVSFFTLVLKASRRLHNEMFSKIVYSPMRFFNTNTSGRILNRFSKDMGSVDEIIPQTLIDTVQFSLSILSISLVIASVNPWIMIPTLIVFGIFYCYRVIFLATSRDVKRIEGITRSPVFSHMTASLQGLTTIRAFNAQENLKMEFDRHQDLNSSAFYTFLASSRTFSLWLDSTSVCYMGMVVFSFLLMGTETYGGNVGLAITQSLSLTGLLQYAMRQWSELENQMTSVERVVEYTEITPEKDEGKITPPKSWPSEGEIEFVDLSMKYSEDEPSVLKHLNFAVSSYEKVGIVGRTGAGKSSLISAFFRLAPIEGKILIDGIDTRDVFLGCLRSKISIIPQEPVLFSGNLRKNLDPFDQYNDEELWDALEEVELKSTIADLPSGLHCTVTEGGTNFSVGQRQLLCLARAIMRSNRILVLDEATANVDPKTDELIQKTIRRKFQNCTVLTIAHRLHTIIDSDKILVMDAGSGVEFGIPYELLKDSEGVFYGLVQQTGRSTAANLIRTAEKAYKEKNKSD